MSSSSSSLTLSSTSSVVFLSLLPSLWLRFLWTVASSLSFVLAAVGVALQVVVVLGLAVVVAAAVAVQDLHPGLFSSSQLLLLQLIS